MHACMHACTVVWLWIMMTAATLHPASCRSPSSGCRACNPHNMPSDALEPDSASKPANDLLHSAAQVVADLRTLRTLGANLLAFDCVTFLGHLESLRASESINSVWLFHEAAHVIFEQASQNRLCMRVCQCAYHCRLVLQHFLTCAFTAALQLGHMLAWQVASNGLRTGVGGCAHQPSLQWVHA